MVTYLPATERVHDEAVRQNFEYIESHAVFDDTELFLRLAPASNWSIDAGNVNVNFPTAQQATTLTVAHALTRTPVAVFLAIATAVGGASITYGAKNYDSDDFEIDAWCSSVLTGDVPFAWAAMG